MDVLLLILRIIGRTLFASLLMCCIYLFRSIVLGMKMEIFKDNIKKNIIFAASAGVILAWVDMIYNLIKHGHI